MLDATVINELLGPVVAVCGWVYLSTADAPRGDERRHDLAWADEHHQDLNRTRVSLPPGQAAPDAPEVAALSRFNDRLLQLVEGCEGRVWIPVAANHFLSSLWTQRYTSDDNLSVLTFGRIPATLNRPGSTAVGTFQLPVMKKTHTDRDIG